MKKPYAESTLKRKYRETGIPKEVLEKLHMYFAACANFYKILSIDEVWKVIKISERRQGKKKLEDILNPTMIDNLRGFTLAEFRRNSEGDDFFGSVDIDNLNPEMEKEIRGKIEKTLRRGVGGFEDLICSAITPLMPEGFNYTDDDFVLTREIFDKVVAIKERSCDRYFVLPEEDLYVDGEADVLYLIDVMTMLEVEDGEITNMYLDDAIEILNMAYYKELFVPDDILCYIDYPYFEETQETEAMKVFLRNAFFSGKNENDEEEETEIQFLMSEMNHIITGSTMSPTEDIKETTEMLEDKGYIFDSFEQTQEFIQYYMNMSNNTRRPSNKGNTPMELRPADGMGMPEKITFGPGIQSMLRSGEWNPEEMKRDIMTQDYLPIELRGDMMREVDKALEPGEERIINAAGTVVKGRKIKPNEPCPCGSGRKYKHCCGRN
ncbi:MAG: SEC-C metal-binding domain-containing protein [Lentihominibacter sp.]|jgi:hypothetical protein